MADGEERNRWDKKRTEGEKAGRKPKGKKRERKKKRECGGEEMRRGGSRLKPLQNGDRYTDRTHRNSALKQKCRAGNRVYI